MGKHAKVLLVTLSVALNVAFVGVWLAHTMSAPSRIPPAYPGPDAHHPIWCPLHRELNVTMEQWRQIEPRLKEFRSTVDSLTANLQGLRTEVVDLLASPQSDRLVIEAKRVRRKISIWQVSAGPWPNRSSLRRAKPTS